MNDCMWHCPRCGRFRPVTDFYTSKGMRSSWCQECLKAYQRERYSNRVGGTRPRVASVVAVDNDGNVQLAAESYDEMARVLNVSCSAVRNAARRGGLLLGSLSIEEVRE